TSATGCAQFVRYAAEALLLLAMAAAPARAQTLTATATVVKTNDDVVGGSLGYGNNGVYFSAYWRPNSPADDGEALAGEFAAPMANGAAAAWMKQWPDGDAPFSTTGCLNGPVTGNGYDSFQSLAVGSDGVYFGGLSYY